MPFLSTALSWIALPVVRWAGIALIGLMFTAYMRYTAAAPWKNQVLELKEAIAARERIIQTHESLVTASEVEAEKLKAEIEGMIHASKDDPNACSLSPAQLVQLQRLARGD